MGANVCQFFLEESEDVLDARDKYMTRRDLTNLALNINLEEDTVHALGDIREPMLFIRFPLLHNSMILEWRII